MDRRIPITEINQLIKRQQGGLRSDINNLKSKVTDFSKKIRILDEKINQKFGPEVDPSIKYSSNTMRGIKSFDLILTVIYFFIYAFLSATMIEKLFVKFKTDSISKDYSNYNNFELISLLIGQFSITVLLSYIGRNILQYAPNPFVSDYVKKRGYLHEKVKETSSGVLLTTIMLMFQPSLKEKTDVLRQKITTQELFIYSSILLIPIFIMFYIKYKKSKAQKSFLFVLPEEPAVMQSENYNPLEEENNE
jgi:hypothetical protein